MSSLLQQLENNEAVLLMYLAGELPDADRTEVEQMLAGDAAMRQVLAELSAAQDQVTLAFASADSAAHDSRREAAVRQVAKAINAAKVTAFRAPQPAAKSSRSRLAIPVWAYPVAAAAMLVIGFMIMSGHRPAAITPPNDEPTQIVVKYDGPAPIIPAVASDDSLSALEKEVLSLKSSNDLDLFGGVPDGDQ